MGVTRMTETQSTASVSNALWREQASSRFLNALSGRDFAALEASLAPVARARFLLPPGAEEYRTADAITRRIESWFSGATEFEMLSSGNDAVGPRQRINWRLRMLFDPSQDIHDVIEQVAFVDVGPDGIEQIDLLCSGFQADESRNELR